MSTTPIAPPSRWRHQIWLRRMVRSVAAVVVGMVIAVGWHQVGIQPGALLMRTIIDSGPIVVTPAGFDEVRKQVAPVESIELPTPGAPPASVRIHRPVTGTSLPVMLWIHGGGFVGGTPEAVADFAILLASRGYLVVSLDYTRAPDAQYPVPVQQGAAALDFIARHATEYGGDPHRVFVGGDSAGGQLASQLAATRTNPDLAAEIGLPAPASSEPLRGVVLHCGLYDLRTVHEVGFPAMRTFLWAYTGHRDWTSAPFIDQLSTIRQATAAYPPTFLTVGDADPLDEQTRKLAGVLTGLGVPTDTLLWDRGTGLGHEYQFDFRRPEAQVAFDRTISFLGRWSR